MARQMGRLTALAVSKSSHKGMYADGGGLYLQVTESAAKSWIYRYKLQGRSREMGLGPLYLTSLAEAREKAMVCRRQRHDGVDPIEARKAARAKVLQDRAHSKTFREVAEAYIEAHKAEWKNPKSAQQWQNTFATYVYPTFGALPVQQVDTDLVKQVLDAIWATKTTTARRVRERIEVVLDAATVQKYRQGENPARWRGHLSALLANPSKIHKVTNHPSLPFAEAPEFMKKLRAIDTVPARALELTILVGGRSSEIRKAKWSEFDLVKRVWTIPKERMKAGREHRIPLSAPALAVLRAMEKIRQNDYVFPGRKKGKPISTMDIVLNQLKRRDVTVHGFRASFRTWASECTRHSRETSEMALSHVIENETEAAYQRGDLFKKRQRLMDDWAKFCGSAMVVPVSLSAAGKDRAVPQLPARPAMKEAA